MGELQKSVEQERILDLFDRIQKIKADIFLITERLKRKTDLLLEVQNNHLRSYEEEIELLKHSCTHAYIDGTLAADKTKNDSIEWGNSNTLKKMSYCAICGKKFHNGYVTIDRQTIDKKLGTFSNEMLEESLGFDDNDIDDNDYIDIDFDNTWQKPGSFKDLFEIFKKKIR